MRLLVCPPDHFAVDYVINPWMTGQAGRVDVARARAQWDALFEDVARVASLEVVAPHAGCPDMCFTANAGLVRDRRALPARFRMREREPEQPHFSQWLAADGFELEALAGPCPFEGEGDALFQPGEPLLWAGYGMRTALETHRDLYRIFEIEVVSLRLVDPRFYHLDTCFAPLPDGRLLYYPEAFDLPSRRAIASRIPADHRLAVSEVDAMSFSCNALAVGRQVFLNAASDPLRRALEAWEFEPRIHPVDEFLKAGGGVKCLSLQLEQTLVEGRSADCAAPERPHREDFRQSFSPKRETR